ncbi:hypothetical protein FGADI_11526 [Fusarium gaditjirri]|uniref:Spherulation-specific family 4 n=1 Tax=Fusarium gaditjirri TaxID=282569 RepID=A0A8H4WQ08_9HYPO|nr:hypothetical protein FGADI_11526 [Fusarium gaditjirri]
MTPAPILRPPHLIIPLYIYPAPGAWEPLLRAARDNPGVSFLVIINPNNGPGAGPLPDANYRNVLRQLGTLGNVHLLGYVYCSYGTRSIDDTQKDIHVYWGWNSDFSVDGIFFDEVPSAKDSAGWMAGLSHFAKSLWSVNAGHSGIVVYNPGVSVGEAFYQDADLIVTFEQSEHQWQNWFLHQSAAENIRGKDAAMIHSCISDARGLTRQIVEMGFGGLYLTDQLGGGYTQWPGDWDRVLEGLDRVSKDR